MPRPIHDLEREHALVRSALHVLQRVASHLEAGLPFPGRDVAVLLRFFREFVEGVHHRKEVRILFPAAVMSGGDAEATCAGLVARSHEDARALLHALTLFWEPEGDLLENERRVFAETCRAYALCLLRCMETEEEQLFRGIRHALPPDEVLALARDFAEIDSQRDGSRAWRAELRRLERTWHG